MSHLMQCMSVTRNTTRWIPDEEWHGNQPRPCRSRQGQPLDPDSGGFSSAPVPADFNTLTEAQRQAIIGGLRNGEQDAIRRQEADQTTTVIHKIAIEDGRITYVGKR